jgi:malate synthase
LFRAVSIHTGLKIAPLDAPEHEEILSVDAMAFLEELHARFGARRDQLLTERDHRLSVARDTGRLDFRPDTAELRAAEWTVVPPRADYQDRRVEITGPTERKMTINALNSGANGFLADFEDAVSPTWHNVLAGQLNLLDAVRGTLTYDGSDGRHYALAERVATLIPRPRGWHLPEKHIHHDSEPMAAALVDFGLFMFHCAAHLVARGEGIYLYLPKLEHHHEARLWNDIFTFTEDALSIPRGTIRATVLIETLPAAFQMDEMLWELREHSYGLNAGRWDYMFSTIKVMGQDPAFTLPDRTAVTMTVPFMRAYTELLVKTCHRRGAYAMGGMAALIPSRSDPEANERALAGVRADKRREAADGFDGTWVAHPDLVGVAREEFDAVLADQPHQITHQRPEVRILASDLLAVAQTPGSITAAGLRGNVNVGFRYLSFWLTGRGAAAINGLMEDAATAEICRAQLWQWIHHDAQLADGRTVTRELVSAVLDEEMARIHDEVGDATWESGRPEETRRIFEAVTLGADLPEFLTLTAYDALP